MFSKIRKTIDNIKLLKRDIDKTDEIIKIKKDNFDKEWNKWGMKKSHVHKIP